MLPRRRDVMGENGGGDRWWVEWCGENLLLDE